MIPRSLILTTILLPIGLSAEPNAGVELEVLQTEIPAVLLEGKPKPIQLPVRHVEFANEVPKIMVPKGTKLLSKGKPVTSSDDAPIIGALELITDGDKDAGEGYYVELLDRLQWVQIDLKKEARVAAIWVWHFHSQKRVYHDVIVQVSNDPKFEKGVTTVYNNDFDNSSKMGRGIDIPYVENNFGLVFDVKGVEGRYVRLYSAGNTSNEMNHYIEVEVFGEFTKK